MNTLLIFSLMTVLVLTFTFIIPAILQHYGSTYGTVYKKDVLGEWWVEMVCREDGALVVVSLTRGYLRRRIAHESAWTKGKVEEESLSKFIVESEDKIVQELAKEKDIAEDLHRAVQIFTNTVKTLKIDNNYKG